MRKIDYEKEYFLKPFEKNMILNGKKTIVIVPKGVYFNNIIHMNGMSARVIRSFKKSLRKLSDAEFKKFGVKIGNIPASCEHPEFIRYYYGNTISSGVRGQAESLRFYIEENPECGLNIDKPYTMVEFSLHESTTSK